MACPTCDHTMHIVLDSYKTEAVFVKVFHCPRCGTVKAEKHVGTACSTNEVTPSLVARVLAFAGKLTEEHQDLIDEFERLGIREAIVKDDGMI